MATDHPPIKFFYKVLRRDNRGIVLVEEHEDYHKAVNRAKELKDIAVRRLADTTKAPPMYYVKLGVEDMG